MHKYVQEEFNVPVTTHRPLEQEQDRIYARKVLKLILK